MKHLTLIAATLGMMALASCSSAKKVPYIPEAETIPAEVLSQMTTVHDPVITPGDLLNIEVTGSNMQALVPFNKGMYVDENGRIARVTLNQTSSTNNYDISTDYYLVNQNGYIDFPSLGQIKVGGKTKLQVQQEITDEIYPKFTRERPKVEIRLMNFRVIMTGAVKNPGIYQSHNERMNFFEALALAGDMDIKGDRENVILYRVNSDGTREVHRLNLNDKDFLLSPYFTLQQNDVIYVTPNKSMANNSWQINPGVQAGLTYLGGLSSLASLVIGIVNLTKK